MNQADSLIFQTEKQLKEFGDKVPADKKAPIETALEAPFRTQIRRHCPLTAQLRR
jgi:molecular chaperone DnaK (HSP70)